jgi:UDP-N-acetylmuramoyl-tripeptide--D-alanyl-D-alanine ligase
MAKATKLKLLELILRLMAKTVLLRRRKVRIVGITGSIGKSSAKEAIFAVLCQKFNVRRNEKNYNNEIGLPLTIIGAKSGNRSIWGWLRVFLQWLWVVFGWGKYPEILILEMGVDHPKDMDYLLSFIRPEVGVVTNISSSHLEFFKTLENIAKEKGKLIEALPSDGLAVLNNDDDLVLGMKEEIEAPFSTFGFGEFAEVSASNAALVYEDGMLQGITFKLSYAGSILPMRLPGIIAPHLIYAALSAVAVGIYFKLNLVEIAEALTNFTSLSGRMKLVRGIKNSMLIDDTYNASPSSTLSALQVLEEISAERKIAVLGDMLELGEESEKGHEEVAQKVFAMKADKFLVVGDRMKKAAEKRRPNNYPEENILFFADPMNAGKALQSILHSGDVVLVKGSQGMRMEKVVEEVMNDPQKANELLCRQSPEWLNIPFVKP